MPTAAEYQGLAGSTMWMGRGQHRGLRYRQRIDESTGHDEGCDVHQFPSGVGFGWDRLATAAACGVSAVVPERIPVTSTPVSRAVHRGPAAPSRAGHVGACPSPLSSKVTSPSSIPWTRATTVRRTSSTAGSKMSLHVARLEPGVGHHLEHLGHGTAVLLDGGRVAARPEGGGLAFRFGRQRTSARRRNSSSRFRTLQFGSASARACWAAATASSSSALASASVFVSTTAVLCLHDGRLRRLACNLADLMRLGLALLGLEVATDSATLRLDDLGDAPTADAAEVLTSSETFWIFRVSAATRAGRSRPRPPRAARPRT